MFYEKTVINFVLLVSLLSCVPTLSSPCPRSEIPLTVSTILGTVTGTTLENGAKRFTLPFAEPPLGPLRFSNPQPLQTFPEDYDGSTTKPSCYQGDLGARGGNPPSEDCLYYNVYVPSTAQVGDSLPVMVWIHGGSFISGSSTAFGLDGSNLANSQNLIVISLQYRLGVFGFFQSQGLVDEMEGGGVGQDRVSGNQALRDVVEALQVICSTVQDFGGDIDRVTLFGQSSGAHMIRSLLETPSASNLFRNAILHSDTANYGDSTSDQSNALGAYVMDQLGCYDLGCLRNQSSEDLLQASYSAYSSLPASDGSYPQGEPWRPVKGSYLTGDVDSPFGGFSKPMILSTVRNEAGSLIGSNFAATTPGSSLIYYKDDQGGASDYGFSFPMLAEGIFNQGRGLTLSEQPCYSTQNDTQTSDSLREALESLATDGLWRCSNQFSALLFDQPQIYLSQTDLAITYPSNSEIDYCQTDRHVCHEDDILTVFGTSTSMDQAQASMSKEIQVRWANFARVQDPNAKGYPTWPSVRSTKVGGYEGEQLDLLHFGSTEDGGSTLEQSQRPQQCGQVWGRLVQFDWQIYG
ncbi:alpha/beta-hydrolase [Violaceomyces palustris]|uniref:Alpha/beta-hydrolase n=1 Tax=Violaceomyces palustris TaxID=1673888 RepID=A0ACD0NXR7_9BASI|nr:alpha/beta-hydrolase [Violaceomyces palustris]